MNLQPACNIFGNVAQGLFQRGKSVLFGKSAQADICYHKPEVIYY